MTRETIQKKYVTYFFISLLGHIAIGISVSWVMTCKPPAILQPSAFLPAYITSFSVKQDLSKTESLIEIRTEANKMDPSITISATKKLNPSVTVSTTKKINKTTETIHPPIKHLQSHSHPQTNHQNYTTEKNISKPLLKLLHDAAAEHLIYPDDALELNKKGIVQVGFSLSPQGDISEIILLKSSQFDELDAAALNAVNAMSPVKDVSHYLQNTTQLAVDIIFE